MGARHKLVAAALGLVVSVGGGLTAVQPATAVSTLFSDDFSGAAGPALVTKDKAGAARGTSRWTEWPTATYNGSAAYGKITTGAADRARLDGAGHLVLTASPSQGTSISTKDSFRAAYGTFTARMMVPKDSGYWPAFWMLNSTPVGGNPQNAKGTVGEVDAIEAYTYYGDGYRRATHNYFPADTSKNWSGSENPLCGPLGGGDIRGTWHDYTAKIEPGKVTFYFDGVQCGNPVLRSEQPIKPYALYSDNTAGLWPILTLAVDTASGAPAPTVDSKLLVDYVKVSR